MDSINHFIKARGCKWANSPTAQQDRRLVDQQFINQALLQECTAKRCASLNLDFINFPFTQL
jgi:hypothetical protein